MNSTDYFQIKYLSDSLGTDNTTTKKYAFLTLGALTIVVIQFEISPSEFSILGAKFEQVDPQLIYQLLFWANCFVYADFLIGYAVATWIRHTTLSTSGLVPVSDESPDPESTAQQIQLEDSHWRERRAVNFATVFFYTKLAYDFVVPTLVFTIVVINYT